MFLQLTSKIDVTNLFFFPQFAQNAMGKTVLPRSESRMWSFLGNFKLLKSNIIKRVKTFK